ncbi:MAG: acyl-CoA dehydrogenase family protein [Frankiaceae bacterium]|nr:acyl-CoA dehydrogenase family protein [Frankiaceae bacterium]
MTATVTPPTVTPATVPKVALPFLDDSHVAFADGLNRWCADNSDLWTPPGPANEQCTAILRRLGADGWLTFLLSDRWDFRSVCLAREILAHADDLADFTFSIQALAAMPLARHGTPAQRDRFLVDLAAGRSNGSFAVSEPAAGSDLAAIALTAEPTDEGWVLDGEKAWIAGATTADVFTVIARTGGAPGALGLSAFLVPVGTPGLVVGDPLSVLAPRPFGHLRFEGCRLPAESLLGRRGQGFVIAMELLEQFRMTVGAAAVGFARLAAEEALSHSRTRRIGSRMLFDLDTTKATLGDMATQLSASWLLVLRAAWEVDQGHRRFAPHSSMAKLHATEAAQQIVDATVAMFGAAGVVGGSVPERLYRQIRLLRIYEGTSEVQRATIAGSLDIPGLTSARLAGSRR